MGALILTTADLAAQRAELPAGVMTGAVGGAYLGWLLWRRGA
jgi:iron complex transport system permease protein